MSKQSRRTNRIALWVAAALSLPAVALANHSWGGYHWARTSNPFTLKTIDSVTSTWDSYLNTSVSDWSQSTVLNLAKEPGDSSGRTTKRCPTVSGKVRVCNNSYGNNGWLGIAGISITGGTHITQGYVKLNDTYYASSTYNTPAWRNLVMCQEIGHTLGLGHNDEDFSTTKGTCMDYSNNPEPNQQPDTHDYQMLEQIYAHLDSTTTLGAAVPSSRGAGAAVADQLDANQRGAWGRLVKASKGHGIEVYELDLGNGEKRITVVTWTLDAAAKRRAEHQHADH